MDPLTAEQKSRIHGLIKEGYGYRTIAPQLEISPDTLDIPANNGAKHFAAYLIIIFIIIEKVINMLL